MLDLLLFVAVGAVACGLFIAGLFGISRDFRIRGDDPGRALLLWWVFWPAAAYLWIKERRKQVPQD